MYILFSAAAATIAGHVKRKKQKTFLTFLTEKKWLEISRRQFVTLDKIIIMIMQTKGLRNHNNTRRICEFLLDGKHAIHSNVNASVAENYSFFSGK